MFTSIITDCSDDNALNRQVTRYSSLLDTPVSVVRLKFFGSEGNGELEGAGNLIDTIDATGGASGVIVVNTAHRDGKGKKWPNGTPFGYFFYKKTLIIATIDGYCLSLAKKFKLTKNINLTDVPTVIDTMIKRGLYQEEFRKLVVDSQFRSYEYVPHLAKWINDGVEIPSKVYSISKVPDTPDCIWWVDNFGNCITTKLPEEIGHRPGKKIKTKYGVFTCYNRMKDVPNGETGLIIGSWGLRLDRFVSLIIQGQSSAKKYGIKSGSPLF